MRIWINHLTRMQKGYICAAGLDSGLQHIRPVLNGRLPAGLLASDGGPLKIGELVDIGPCRCTGSVPEVEDHLFDQSKILSIKTEDENVFWDKLTDASEVKLADIFGSDLKAQGPGCVVAVGAGIASLGCLRDPDVQSIYVNDDGTKVRIKLADQDFGELNLSVTDVRCFKKDHVTPNKSVVEGLKEKLCNGIEIILSVGLGRPYPPSNPVHWLQVNNIHFKDNPSWNL